MRATTVYGIGFLTSLPFAATVAIVTRALSGYWNDEFFMLWLKLFYGLIAAACTAVLIMSR